MISTVEVLGQDEETGAETSSAWGWLKEMGVRTAIGSSPVAMLTAVISNALTSKKDQNNVPDVPGIPDPELPEGGIWDETPSLRRPGSGSSRGGGTSTAPYYTSSTGSSGGGSKWPWYVGGALLIGGGIVAWRVIRKRGKRR